MAQVAGEAGAHQANLARQRILRIVVIAMVVLGVLEVACGFAMAKHGILWALGLVIVFIPTLIWLRRYVDAQVKQMAIEQRAAKGEVRIAAFLEDLPDSYLVFNDVDFADSYGNIDHIVIGPKGFFAIDAKNWRGIVSSDGKGELRLNGSPTGKPHVRQFTRRVMELKDRIKALKRLDPYIQGLFVFLNTRIEAKWGTTGAVHCLHPEQLVEYITEKSRHSLSPQMVHDLGKCVSVLIEAK